MPTYNFTSDLRISELQERIKTAAKLIATNTILKQDKSTQNNANTLAFYFNLQPGSRTLELATEGHITEVVRNMVLKFQYPNVYTSQLFEANKEEGVNFAPLREIVKLLMYIHLADSQNLAYLTQEEILRFVFLDERIIKETIDAKGYLTIAQEILDNRKSGQDNYEKYIEQNIIWPQYQRQSRELIRILTYASEAFVVKSGKIYLNLPKIDDPKYSDVLHFISSALLINTTWETNSTQCDTATKASYVKYMDMEGEVIITSEAYPVDAKPELDIKVSNNKTDYLAAMRTKPFMLLAGISGTGKSRIVRKLAQATVPKNLQDAYDDTTRSSEAFKEERWSLHRPANFELIQVKPNWHNSMDVVGYLSNIPSPHYVFTPFINFIVRAMCHPEVPFFLCLDEMNLAPVEEYFAEFLSAIESRAKTKDGYMTDPIIPAFKTFGEVKDQKGVKTNVGEDMLATISEILKKEMISDTRRSEIRKHLEEKGVTLPENLIIVGTVNMDETTFSFSRKVLDRAMSMEMNKVDYSSFLFDTTDDDIKAIAEAYKVDSDASGEGNELNRLLVDRHIEAKEVVTSLGGAEEGSDARFVIDYLETINKLLDGTPFKLGYRAANEALIYLQSTRDFGSNDRAAAMDRFTMMKILSRIEGDESKLRLTQDDSKRLTECGVDFHKISQATGGATLLSAMREIIAKGLGEYETVSQAEDSNIEDVEIEGEETATPKAEKPNVEPRESIKKLEAMMAQLDRDHFVSYWS